MNQCDKDRVVRLICSYGDLACYKSIISNLVDKTDELNCTISCRCDGIRSSIEQSIYDHVESRIRIDLMNKNQEPLHIIWDILHELGHLISGKKNDTVRYSIERERIAWEIAYREMMQYEALSIYSDDFIRYKDKCLKSYRANHTSSEA
jgi:hypothetical protein